MFNFASPKDETHQLDGAIAKLIDEIDSMQPGDEAHTQAVLSLKVLMEARAADKAAKKPLVSPDAVTAAAAHLLGIGMILGFEKANVITSKALGFVPRSRS